ncbi:nickel pincer cofactor biosynthesis protein LarC [Lacticaseibacillus saniviri]
MRTLYLDVISGISGDMFLGALLDLGVDLEAVKTELAKLNVAGYSLSAEKTAQSAIFGTSFRVQLDHGTMDTGFTEHTHDHHHDHDHDHSHDATPYVADAHEHTHQHEHDHEHGHHHHHGGARHYTEIVDLIQSAALSDYVKQHALAIFKAIAEAEAKVHNVSMAEVHFHEVGAVDSIVDIVGGCIALEQLHVDRVISSPLVDGTGFITVAHGKMPIPVPAVMQMRAGTSIPVHQRDDIHTELVTPTGMGIVKTLVTSFEALPSNLTVEKVGYGFGTRDIGQINALRVMLGTTAPLSQQVVETNADDVLEMSANIDDQSAESLAPIIDRLVAAGAYDAYFEPIQMKKNRPALKLTVLANPVDQAAMTHLLLQHTTTAGVRYQTLHRTIMQRHFSTVTTEFGDVRVKHLTYQGIEKTKPEFEDCERIANTRGITLQEVYRAVYRQLDSAL